MLLGDLHQVGGRPIHHQPGREDESPDTEQDRHDPCERLLLLVDRARRCPLHLSLLVVGGGHHQYREHVIRDPHRYALAAIQRGTHELLRFRRSRLVGHRDIPAGFHRRAQQVRSQKVHPGSLCPDVRVELAVWTVEAQDRVQRDQHRDLQQHGQAPGYGIDSPLLVQPHHLLVELLLVTLVLLLEGLHLGLDGLHGLHGPHLLDAEGQQDHPDDQRQQDDGHAVVRHPPVQRGQNAPDPVQEGLEPHDRDHAEPSTAARGLASWRACMSASYNHRPRRAGG